MNLAELPDFDHRGSLCEFLATPWVSALRWPTDVVEQWLFDHGTNPSFIADYGSLALESLVWRVEIVSRDAFLGMPTGTSDEGCIEEYARDPQYWVESRAHGTHIGVAEMWEAHGTWKRWPLLIDRQIQESEDTGLQVIEGRTRVGVLRGRHRKGLFVAPSHLAWVARSVTPLERK